MRDDLVHRIAGEAEHREGDEADREQDADGLKARRMMKAIMARSGTPWPGTARQHGVRARAPRTTPSRAQ